MSAKRRRSLLLFLLLIISAVRVDPAHARSRHVITFSAPGLLPGSLAWDPDAQHFVVGSRASAAAVSVSDAGVVEPLLSFPNSSSAVAAIVVDSPRRRLLVALSDPPVLAAFDLRQRRPPLPLLLSSPLPSPPSSLAVDPSSGLVYVTSATDAVIYKVDVDGNVSDFSKPAIDGSGGLGPAAYVSKGYLLVVQASTGRVFKVDEDLGTARLLLMAGKKGISAAAVAMRSDGTAVVAGGSLVRLLGSDDGWGEAVVRDEAGIEGGRVVGVAVREKRRAYVLVAPPPEEEEKGGYKIEEVEWGGEEKEGEMVVGLVLLGLGLAYFLYWRFQMGQLVTNMNKKRA